MSLYDTMRPLHKTNIDDETSLVPKEGEREVLCSNKACLRSPSLGSESETISEEEEEEIKKLAKILIGIFLKINGYR